jgi:hypothetical protein
MRKKDIKEGSGMIVSAPWNPDRNPPFVDMVTRELDKLLKNKRISPAAHHQAYELAHGQKKVLNAIYSKVANGAQQGSLFILRQIPK